MSQQLSNSQTAARASVEKYILNRNGNLEPRHKQTLTGVFAALLTHYVYKLSSKTSLEFTNNGIISELEQIHKDLKSLGDSSKELDFVVKFISERSLSDFEEIVEFQQNSPSSRSIH